MTRVKKKMFSNSLQTDVSNSQKPEKEPFSPAKFEERKIGTKALGQHLLKSGQFAYVGRRDRKSNFRSVWIGRISGSLKTNANLSYNAFISKLKNNKIVLNRKMLAQLTVRDEPAFLVLNNL